MKNKLENGTLTLWLEGRIDSSNAAPVEKEITAIREADHPNALILDCEGLQYISSAGLRIVLRLKKAIPDMKLVNVSSEVYDILEMTGFSEMMEVHKAYRVLSVEGCEVIGRGANGKVYRIDRDTVVKTYMNPEALADIHKERELARTAFVLGVPTAIPYDVVRIEGGGYGSVFELIDATNFAKLLTSGEKSVDEIAEMSVALLKIIHSTVVKPESMPSMKQIALNWVDFLKPYLPSEQFEKLRALFDAVPEDCRLLHGDYHIKNITTQGDENLILDMDTLCHGHPIFEFGSIYNAYIGFGELDSNVIREFMGIEPEAAASLWEKTLRLYFPEADDAAIRGVEDKARIIGYTRMLRRRIRRNGFETEAGRREIEYFKAQMAELLQRVDCLTF